jgi:hypothetical protein
MERKRKASIDIETKGKKQNSILNFIEESTLDRVSSDDKFIEEKTPYKNIPLRNVPENIIRIWNSYQENDRQYSQLYAEKQLKFWGFLPCHKPGLKSMINESALFKEEKIQIHVKRESKRRYYLNWKSKRMIMLNK